jgi:hypothetical protein
MKTTTMFASTLMLAVWIPGAAPAESPPIQAAMVIPGRAGNRPGVLELLGPAGPGPAFSLGSGGVEEAADSPETPPRADARAPKTAEKQEDSHEELAKKLQNPIANLISVPFQSNFDFGFGNDEHGWRYTLNIQPVIPITLTEALNLITRTIVPVIYQGDVVDDGGPSQFGLGDITQSFFFSPKKPAFGKLIWGIGPAFLWPTATNDSLGTEKWGAGPTGVALVQEGPWTIGLLVNHIWSYAGDDNRSDVNSTFLQPFVSHTWKSGFSLGVNTESTYDWEGDQWTAPINLFASQLVKFGKLPVNLEVGGRYYVEAPDGGPEWGLRFVVVILLPK